jgi:uncharacterized BrkB/YihY/UPF0761 family membrane protein
MGIGMMGLSLLLTAMLITGMFSGIYSYASIVIIAMLLAVGAIITYGGIEILKAGTYWQNTIDST